MSFSANGMPLDGPNGSFPRQRIGNAGTVVLKPVRDVEGQYMDNEVAQLPTQEQEYSSVVNSAKNHLLFGEVKRQSNMKKMGGGFQREMDRKKLMARPMPGHTGDERMEVRERLITNLGPRRMMGSSTLSGVGESMMFGPRSVSTRIGMGNSGRSDKGFLFRLFGTDNIPNDGLGESRVFGRKSLGRRIGVGNTGRSENGWMFRMFGTGNKKIPNFGMGSDRDQNF